MTISRAFSHASKLILLCMLVNSISAQKNYTYSDLEFCTLGTVELSKLGPDDDIEPCILFNVGPYNFAPIEEDKSATIHIVQVTPSSCGNHRDGAVTAVDEMNKDNGGRGIAIGFNSDYYVTFQLVSVIAGNANSLPEAEYSRRHTQILDSMLQDLNAPYIIGSCSFAAAMDKQPALDNSAIVLSQVGPPGFYMDDNPYVFGIHINSDTYPLPNVRSLEFLADDIPGGPAQIPVRIIYRTKSEFFYSTCKSAIDELTAAGFTDMKEILYDHSADHDGDGDINQFDEDFLKGLADKACPPGSGDSDYHPALFLCTLTEHDILLDRLVENGCRPVSTWVTAATWGWADANPELVPYFQGGGQWHRAFRYSDKYFDSGYDVLLRNERFFGYLGNYDQVVSYTVPMVYSQHLVYHYRVIDEPNPLADFADPAKRELLRRAMLILNVETIFGPVSFNEYQRNVGRGAAGTQWLPLKSNTTFSNALVSPLFQAEATSVIPAESALPCDSGEFINQTSRIIEGSILSGGCSACPVDFYTLEPSQVSECTPCPEGSTTDGMESSDKCYIRNDNLLSPGIIAFGYTAAFITWILSFSFMAWLVLNRDDPVVKVSQMEFCFLICFGAVMSSSTIIALSFQAGTGEDTSAASAGCTAAPYLYAIGWVLQYSSLSAKTFRLFKIMRGNQGMKRVTVTFFEMARVVIAALVIDLILLIIWGALSPLVYERTDETISVDEDTGVVTLSSVGRCVPENDQYSFWAFAGPLVAFHIFLVVATNALLYSVSSVSDRYQEQKYVAMASMLMFEILVVGVPVLVSVGENPEAMYIVLTGIIALDDIGILCFIFVPKIYYQRRGLEEGVGFGESIMRESHKKASQREYSRREVSSYSQHEGSGSASMGLNSASSRPTTRSQSSGKRDSFVMRLNGQRNDASGYDSSFGSIGPEMSIAEETSSEIRKELSNRMLNVDPVEPNGRSKLVRFASDHDSSHASEHSSQTGERNVSPIPPISSVSSRSESSDKLDQASVTDDSGRVFSESSASSAVSSQIPQTDAVESTQLTDGNTEESITAEQQRIAATTTKLLEEHQRMMDATSQIMKEHERIKQRLLDQQEATRKAAEQAEIAQQKDTRSVEGTPTPAPAPAPTPAPTDLVEHTISPTDKPIGSNPAAKADLSGLCGSRTTLTTEEGSE